MGDLLTETDLRVALRELSGDAPSVADVLPAAAGDRLRRRRPVRWIAPLAAALVVVLAAALTVGLLQRGSRTGPTDHQRAGNINELVDITWRPTSIGGRVPTGLDALTIRSNGRFSQIFETCFGVQGRVTVTASSLTFGRTSLLSGMCPATERSIRDERQAQANWETVQKVLTGSLTWSVTGRHLTLRKTDSPILEYTRPAQATRRLPASSSTCFPSGEHAKSVPAYVGLTLRAARVLARTRHEHLQFFGGGGQCIAVVTLIPQHSVGVVFSQSGDANGRFPASAVVVAAQPVH